MSKNKILEIFNPNFNIPSTPPIWIMRQAGRYLPEYKKIREDIGSFLDLCYNPSKSAEVTLQPIDRFDLDAAIIFSDILTIPHSLGLDVSFEKDHGPKVEIIEDSKGLSKLKIDKDNKKLHKTYEAISLVKSRLSKNKALIGFIGAPWTISTYILEGKGKHNFEKSRKIAYNDPSFLDNLIAIIAEQSISHILGQIKAGADVIQIFDSWAGILSEVDYERFVINPTIKIIKLVKSHYPDVPIIGFPKGSGYLYENYISKTSVNAISIDSSIPVNKIYDFSKLNVVVQGNLDPVILLSNKNLIKERAELLLTKLSNTRFIFNLGHGILPETPIENVEFLIKCVRTFSS